MVPAQEIKNKQLVLKALKKNRFDSSASPMSNPDFLPEKYKNLMFSPMKPDGFEIYEFEYTASYKSFCDETSVPINCSNIEQKYQNKPIEHLRKIHEAINTYLNSSHASAQAKAKELEKTYKLKFYLEKTKVIIDELSLSLGIPINKTITVYTTLPMNNMSPSTSTNLGNGATIISIDKKERTKPIFFILKLDNKLRYFVDQIQLTKEDFTSFLLKDPILCGIGEKFLTEIEKSSLESSIVKHLPSASSTKTNKI